jgi:SNF2 family DNA or RNA helicase
MGLGKTMQTIGLILANPPGMKIRKGLKSKPAGPRCTLIVSPVMPMEHWKTEIKTVVKTNALKVEVFHGSNRQNALTKVQTGSVDILLTTYETLASHYQSYQAKLAEEAEFAKNAEDDEEEPDEREPFLFELEFWRVVLDEAQNIRNKNTKGFKSVMAVDAVNSWCLTGTPIVNKPDDLQPYFECMFVSCARCYRHNAHFYHTYIRQIVFVLLFDSSWF